LAVEIRPKQMADKHVNTNIGLEDRTLSYTNGDTAETGYINHAEITMQGTDLPLRPAFSDVNGHYQISNVLVGKYQVIANLATATNLSDFEFPLDVY
jgi:hypothetical protein